MGRGKIDIKRIENASSRQVTFAKRRVGLVKKAQELAILCDVEVGLIIFSSAGKRFDFASSSMNDVIERYMKSTSGKETPKDPQSSDTNNVKSYQALFSEHILGEDIEQFGLHDLNYLEKQMQMGLNQVRAQKGRLLMLEMEALNNKGQKLQVDNKDVKAKIDNVKRFLEEPHPSSSIGEALKLSLQPMHRNYSDTWRRRKRSPLRLF